MKDVAARWKVSLIRFMTKAAVLNGIHPMAHGIINRCNICARLGGKALGLNTDGDNVVEWPVTAGTYRLDITDADGKILARTPFSAGWDLPEETEQQGAGIALDATPPTLRAGIPVKIHFKLDEAAVIVATITDDRVRQVIQQPMQAGDNSISFTPSADWGNRLLVRIENPAHASAGEATLYASRPTLAPNNVLNNGIDINAKIPAVMMEGDSARVLINIQNDEAKAATYHYIFSSEGGTKLTGETKSTLAATSKGQFISLGLNAAQAGAGAIVMDITGPQAFHDSHRWPVTITTRTKSGTSVTTQTVDARKAITLKADDNAGVLFVAGLPLFNTPAILATALQSPTPSVADAAARLQLLRHWHDVITKAGLMPDALVTATQEELTARILLAQKSGCSFFRSVRHSGHSTDSRRTGRSQPPRPCRGKARR